MPKRVKYRTTKDDSWRSIRRRDFRIACCGCGLVHRYNYRIKDRHLQRQCFIDQRATAAIRRYMSLEDFAEVSAIIQRKVRAFNATLKRNKRKSK